MIQALKDAQSVSTLLAVLNTDTVQGTNLVRIKLNPLNGAIKVNSVATIAFTPKAIDPKDQNYVNCWLFQGTDGLTYPAAATSAGELLIDTN